MNQIDEKELNEFIKNLIDEFHKNRMTKLGKLSLSQLLRRKNPYLFRAKNLLTADKYVKSLLTSNLIAGEEASFGKLLEKLVIFICEKKYSGFKSYAKGPIDLEFKKNRIRYLISIKSGPNWGNSSQITYMKSGEGGFDSSYQIIRQTDTTQHIEFIEGCCYGRCEKEAKMGYLKKCGQSFWEFITDDDTFYLKIIEPMGTRAKEIDEEYKRELLKVYTRFLRVFLDTFCVDDEINWKKVIEFNSSRKRHDLPRRKNVKKSNT